MNIPSENYKPMLLGLGFDGKNPHQYITRGDNFYLTGGSEKTHDNMVENVMRFNELLTKYGKKMEDLTPEEYYNIVEEIGSKKINWIYNSFKH